MEDINSIDKTRQDKTRQAFSAAAELSSGGTRTNG